MTSRTPLQVTDAAIAWLRGNLGTLSKDIAACRKNRSWTAVATMHRERRATRSQLDEILRQRAELAHASEVEDPATLSPEAWAARVRESAVAATDDDLEVFVGEWLRRRGYLLLSDAGALVLRKIAA